MLYAPASDALKPVTVGNSLFSAKSSLFGARNFPVRCRTGNRPQHSGIAAQMDAGTRRKVPKWPEIFNISLLFSLFSGKASRLWGRALSAPSPRLRGEGR